MAKQQVFPVIKLGGLAPMIGLSVLFLAGGIWGLLPGSRSQHSTGGFPLWLLGIGMLLAFIYFWIMIIKTIIVRRNNPDMKNWSDPSA